jgi:hypothetical protein
MHVLGKKGRYEPELPTELKSAVAEAAQAIIVPSTHDATVPESENPSVQSDSYAPSMVTTVGNPPLTVTSAADLENASAEFLCKQCEPARGFSSQDAFYQHFLAKHVHTSTTTSTSVSTESSTTTVDDADSTKSGITLPLQQIASEGASDGDDNSLCEVCPACGKLVVMGSLQSHMDSFQPPDHPQLNCERCNRLFLNQRALEQHSIFCNLERTRAVLSSGSISR